MHELELAQVFEIQQPDILIKGRETSYLCFN